MPRPVRPLDVTLALRAARGRSGRGLTADEAQRIARIVLQVAEVSAVAITDSVRILAYEGDGCPHMRPGQPVQTKATRQVLRTGKASRIECKADLQCPVQGCPCAVQAAVIAPLKLQGEVIGTVKLYSDRPGPMPGYAQRLALGISELLSLQAEMQEVEHQRELLAKAQFETLQAQIRPHFLFNTLNTVIATSRVDPDLARELLSELAAFLRRTISDRRDRTTVAEEAAFVEQYLRLEQARFGARIVVRQEIDPRIRQAEMPVLVLQPLVENAIVHGLAPKEGRGRLTVSARRRGEALQFAVIDDGVGIPPERLGRLYSMDQSATGLGLANIAGRLSALYGPLAGLRLRSREGKGTAAFLRIPYRQAERD